MDETVLLAIEARDKATAIIEGVVAKLHSIGPAADAGAVGAARMAENFAKAHPAMIATGIAGAAVAVGVGAIAIESVKAAANFQESMTQLVTGAGETKDNLELVSEGIMKTARDTGESVDMLSKGMYLIESAGFHGADGLKVLQAAAEGAKVGNADMNTVANAVTSALNAYGMKADDAGTMTSKMVAAVGQGKMHMEDFAGSMSAVLPVASAAGISFDQVAGAIATMTAQGMSAQQASQDLANMIRNLQSVNGPALAMLQQMGIDVTDLETHLGERGLTGTLDIVNKAIQDHTKNGLIDLDAMKLSKSGTEQLRNMISHMPPALAEMAQKFMDGQMSMKNFQKAFKDLGGEQYAEGKQFLTLAQQVDGFNNNVKAGKPVMMTAADAMKTLLGGATGLNTGLLLSGDHAQTFADNVAKIGGATEDAEGHVKGWDEVQQDFNTKLAQAGEAFETMKIAIGQALLPVMSDLMGKVSGFIGPIADWITRNKEIAATILIAVGAIGALVAIMAVLTMAMTIFAAHPVVLAIMAIVAAVAILAIGIHELIVHWSEVTAFGAQVWGGFVNWLKGLLDQFGAWWHSWWDPFFKVVSDVWNNIVTVAKYALAILLTVVLWPISLALNELGAVWNWLYTGVIKPAWDGIVSAARVAWDWLLPNVIQPILDWILRVGQGFTNFWQQFVVPAWRGIVDFATASWNNLYSGVIQPIIDWVSRLGEAFMFWWQNVIIPVWNGVRDTATTVWLWLEGSVFKPIADAVHTMADTFGWGRDRIVEAWNAIKDAALAPVRFIVDQVYDQGILPVWNAVAGVVGVGQLQPLSFATGGVVPGYSPGNDIVDARLSPGEGILIPQAVRALGGASGIEAINRMFGGGGNSSGNHFADGGVVGDVGDVLSAIGGAVSNALGAVGNFVLGGVKAAATPLVQLFEKGADDFLGTGTKDLRGWLDHGVHTLGDGFLNWLGGKDDTANKAKAAQSASIGSPGAVSGDLTQWIAAAMGAVGVSGGDWANGLAIIAMHESGGNPNATNGWDINAINGDPSRGLMQTIGSTFEAYRLASLPDNIFDPVANIAAGIRYIQSRYGGIGGVPGLISMANGGAYVGYDEGGWLEPGLTLAYNGTGQREAITSPSGAGPRGGGNVVYLDFRDAHVMSDADIQILIDRIGRELAAFVLPAAGVQIRR